MKIIMPLIIFGFTLWAMIKIIKFFIFIRGIFTPDKQTLPPVIKAAPRPVPKASAPIESEPEDLRIGIDRAFEDMGLDIRFGHLNKGSQNMLKKAWAVRRTPAAMQENVRPEGRDLEPSFEHQLARESAPERAIAADSTLHFALCTLHPLHQWVVFNEIFSPPLALREE